MASYLGLGCLYPTKMTIGLYGLKEEEAMKKKRLSFVLHYLPFRVFIKIELFCVLLDDSGIKYIFLSANEESP